MLQMEGEKNEMYDKSKLDYSEANKYENDPELEIRWAVKAYQHAETYFNLLSALDAKLLKLTKKDDDIYALFRSTFPDLEVGKMDVDFVKSDKSKEKWRPWCEAFKDHVEDYNMATLIRVDSAEEYSENNTCIVPRIQFYAIEIARNREGHNAIVKQKFGKIVPKQ